MSSINRHFRTTPRQLQGYLTVADLSYTSPHQPTHTTAWPNRPDSMGRANFRTGCMFHIVLMFWSFLLLFDVASGLSKRIARLFRAWDWLEVTGYTTSHDLLYQLLGVLSASRLGDEKGDFRLSWNPKAGTAIAGDATTLDWNYKAKQDGVTLRLTTSDTCDKAQDLARTEIIIDLQRPDGGAAVLPKRWPSWLEVEHRGHVLVWTFEQTLADRLRAARGKARIDDRPRRVARLFAELLHLNNLDAPTVQTTEVKPVQMARINPLTHISPEGPDGPRSAPLSGQMEPHTIGWWQGGWGLRRWWAAMAMGYLIVPALCGVPMVLSYLSVGALAVTDNYNPGMIFAAATGLAAIAVATLHILKTTMPPLTRRVIRDPGDAQQIRWDGVSLLSTSTRAQIALDQPFVVHLSRSRTDAGEGQIWLGVHLRPRGRTAANTQGLRFRILTLDHPDLDSLPELDTRAPEISSSAFMDWLWPLIASQAQLHDEPLSWTTLSTHATPAPPLSQQATVEVEEVKTVSQRR